MLAILTLATLAITVIGYAVAVVVLRKPTPDTGTFDPYLVRVATGSELHPGGHGGVRAAGRQGTLTIEAIARSHGKRPTP